MGRKKQKTKSTHQPNAVLKFRDHCGEGAVRKKGVFPAAELKNDSDDLALF